ncbi:hypothetical protein GOX01_08290 [Gluconobacter oxydans]|uniref:Uncharacterized protein n=1 Tax=Gluconobacter oxydans TaxID=442 RepID=A0AB35AMN9_GLUOY|nr:hypothetical protein [Gluconobacter oxydans]MBF0856020.1 hypothetical protein [Gluconobacter oxydans]TCW27540.1 hypothetical protein EDC20_10671 [Gluconobacter oxydans]GEC60498.1 hypothetical protein GOX01_08290 [Gluconobacter oxydans]
MKSHSPAPSRAAIEALAQALIDYLDVLDAPNEDLEPNGDEEADYDNEPDCDGEGLQTWEQPEPFTPYLVTGTNISTPRVEPVFGEPVATEHGVGRTITYRRVA